MLIFLGVLLATFVVYFLRFHYKIIHAFYLSLKIGGPTALPLVGNGLLFLSDSSVEIFDKIIKILHEYGDFFRIWLGPELNVIISDPKDIEVRTKMCLWSFLLLKVIGVEKRE